MLHLIYFAVYIYRVLSQIKDEINVLPKKVKTECQGDGDNLPSDVRIECQQVVVRVKGFSQDLEDKNK